MMFRNFLLRKTKINPMHLKKYNTILDKNYIIHVFLAKQYQSLLKAHSKV